MNLTQNGIQLKGYVIITNLYSDNPMADNLLPPAQAVCIPLKTIQISSHSNLDNTALADQASKIDLTYTFYQKDGMYFISNKHLLTEEQLTSLFHSFGYIAPYKNLFRVQANLLGDTFYGKKHSLPIATTEQYIPFHGTKIFKALATSKEGDNPLDVLSQDDLYYLKALRTNLPLVAKAGYEQEILTLFLDQPMIKAKLNVLPARELKDLDRNTRAITPNIPHALFLEPTPRQNIISRGLNSLTHRERVLSNISKRNEQNSQKGGIFAL